MFKELADQAWMAGTRSRSDSTVVAAEPDRHPVNPPVLEASGAHQRDARAYIPFALGLDGKVEIFPPCSEPEQFIGDAAERTDLAQSFFERPKNPLPMLRPACIRRSARQVRGDGSISGRRGNLQTFLPAPKPGFPGHRIGHA